MHVQLKLPKPDSQIRLKMNTEGQKKQKFHGGCPCSNWQSQFSLLQRESPVTGLVIIIILWHICSLLLFCCCYLKTYKLKGICILQYISVKNIT